jgi:ribonuclease D
MVDDQHLAQLHADLVERLEQDKRLRALEASVAALQTIPTELTRMEDRIMRAIADVKEAARPRPIWPAVSALVASLALVLVVAQAIYAK